MQESLWCLANALALNFTICHHVSPIIKYSRNLTPIWFSVANWTLINYMEYPISFAMSRSIIRWGICIHFQRFYERPLEMQWRFKNLFHSAPTWILRQSGWTKVQRIYHHDDTYMMSLKEKTGWRIQMLFTLNDWLHVSRQEPWFLYSLVRLPSRQKLTPIPITVDKSGFM